jgi:outer membrane immunogenic protein
LPPLADASPILTKARQTGWAGAASPAADWTGIYVGVNGGFTFGGSAWSDSVTGSSSGSFRTSGFVFGGTVGANYQAGSLVFGVEADSDWADAGGFGTFTATSLCVLEAA